MSTAAPSATRLHELVRRGRIVETHHPWPRAVVSAEEWRHAGQGLATGAGTLLGLWGERDRVHIALDDGGREIAVLSIACDEKRFPSIGRMHPPAIRLERALRDLWSLQPEGLDDTRPWLDHGKWLRGPSSAAGMAPVPPAYAFLPSAGESLHQIPVGPVHAGIIEPGHFRFTANGETVVRLEERLGYVHKGIAGLMRGAPLDRAARLAGRMSGDSTVAYAYAFARAVEAAAGIEAPPRAQLLRALMAELERVANHLGDIGAIANDASFGMMHAHCAVLRERVLRFAGDQFGHRLMMDAIVPGGVAVDLSDSGGVALRALVDEIENVFPRLVEVYDNTASLQDRTVGTGILRPELAARFGAGGPIGRASGRAFDARKTLPYPPDERLHFTMPGLAEGDVNARVWIRIREIEQSLKLLTALSLP